MKMRIFYFPGLLLILLIGFTMCKNDEIKIPLMFQGQVVDENGEGIAEALIEVGDRNTRTNEKGSFAIQADSTDRYVLNVTRLGYGFVSKIYNDTVSNILITMTTATVDTIEVDEQDEVIVIEDTTPPPPESSPPSSDITTVSSPVDTIAFVYNAKGRLIAFGAPPEVAETYAAAEAFEPPQEGATVEVPADALEEGSEGGGGGGGGGAALASFFQREKEEESAKGKIIGSLSTVDLYSPDGMPGDYTVRYDDGSEGWMVPFGAADVNFYRNGKPLQLRNGQYAKLTIPVDTIAQMYFGENLREKIPLFVYDHRSGEWKRDRDKWTKEETWGELNKGKTAYVARISHFSVYNMDEDRNNPSCTRLLNSTSAPDLIPNNAQIEVAVPGHINMFPFGDGCLEECGATGFNIHAIARMKENEPIGMRIFDDTGVIKSTYVLIGGAQSGDVFGANCGDIAYCSCQSNLTISYASPTYMNTDGTMSKPHLAIQKFVNFLKISWIYVPERDDSGGSPVYTTTNPRQYSIEWSYDATFTALQGTYTLPAANTDWINSYDLPFTGITTDDDTQLLKFRISVDDPAAPLTPIKSDVPNKCFLPEDPDSFPSC